MDSQLALTELPSLNLAPFILLDRVCTVHNDQGAETTIPHNFSTMILSIANSAPQPSISHHSFPAIFVALPHSEERKDFAKQEDWMICCSLVMS